MELPSLQIRSVRARAVNAPIITPLITSRGSVDVAPLLLVDVETEEGVTGHGYAFCYMDLAAPFLVSVIERIDEMVRGEAADPRFLYKSLRGRFTLVGTEGSLGMALSAFDIACWDACAKAAGLPLYKLLGSNRNTIPAYNSKGLSLKEPAELADEALALLGEGFKAVKLRLGRRDVMADREAAKVVREAVPAGTVVMVDYNQALTPEDMIGRLALLEEFDPAWIEEPVRHDDFLGCARIKAASRIPIQLGENFNSPAVMAAAIHIEACDYAMPDIGRIGGVSGWLEAARIADAADMAMSSHLYPEVSVHVLAATPTCHYLEYVDWAEPVLQTPITIKDGQAIIPDTPGLGLEWDEEAVARYRLD
ncbi:MAG: enolase C-terminal domain-like protein [Rhodospirillales bacterium]